MPGTEAVRIAGLPAGKCLGLAVQKQDPDDGGYLPDGYRGRSVLLLPPEKAKGNKGFVREEERLRLELRKPKLGGTRVVSPSRAVRVPREVVKSAPPPPLAPQPAPPAPVKRMPAWVESGAVLRVQGCSAPLKICTTARAYDPD